VCPVLALLEPEHEYDRQILKAIASSDRVTQRSLSGELGVALGLTNLLIRRLVGKGYVRMSRVGTRHVRYLMTPAGLEALGNATRLSMANTVHLYTETREQICASLTEVSKRCAPDANGEKRVVFYGAGDVAEIAYVSLQRTDLRLVGVVDDKKRGKFFDLPISDPAALTAETIEGIAYSRLVVASIRPNVIDAIQAHVAERGIPTERMSCL
jgi:DNA-binding MarR family transcriptional regulator